MDSESFGGTKVKTCTIVMFLFWPIQVLCADYGSILLGKEDVIDVTSGNIFQIISRIVYTDQNHIHHLILKTGFSPLQSMGILVFFYAFCFCFYQ